MSQLIASASTECEFSYPLSLSLSLALSLSGSDLHPLLLILIVVVLPPEYGILVRILLFMIYGREPEPAAGVPSEADCRTNEDISHRW